VRGRDFDSSDGSGRNQVAIVNETLVHEFFSSTDPLGKRIKLKESNNWLTIVGVIADVHGSQLELRPRPAIYRHHRQDPGYWDEMTIVVRSASTGVLPSFEGVLRREIGKIDATLPLANFRTIESVLSDSMARPRFSSFLLSLFAATALVLTMVGLYGVVAYSVSQRTRELGIRVALGAQRKDLLAIVMGQGMRPALVGLVFGIAGALALTRFLTSQLYEINPTDPFTLTGVSIVLMGVAMVACWLPARRAAGVDPVVALRAE
jgi:putative ABC transport system permease protein